MCRGAHVDLAAHCGKESVPVGVVPLLVVIYLCVFDNPSLVAIIAITSHPRPICTS